MECRRGISGTLDKPLEFAATFRNGISAKFAVSVARPGQLILDGTRCSGPRIREALA
jgi:hypothetical protein